MDKFYNETYLKLETAIQELEIETDCPIKRIEAVIHHIIQSLADLKDFVPKMTLRIWKKKSIFSSIRNLLLFQSSSTTMPSIKSKQEDPTGTSVPRNILPKN